MDISTMKARKSEQGFTLVELAVVMIIIGLLIGGILKGQELITNARVTTTASTMESFSAAYNGFRDQYGGLPGDMSNATDRIAGCDDIAACLDSATANGILDIGVGEVPATEGVGFFGQLLAGGFITGMTGSDDGTNVEFGVTNPSAPIGGGLTVGDERDSVVAALDNNLRGAVHLVLTGRLDQNVAADNGPLSVGQAANIDRRLDDGAPETGTITGDTGCNDGAAASPVYDEADLTTTCSIAYRL